MGGFVNFILYIFSITKEKRGKHPSKHMSYLPSELDEMQEEMRTEVPNYIIRRCNDMNHDENKMKKFLKEQVKLKMITKEQSAGLLIEYFHKDE